MLEALERVELQLAELAEAARGGNGRLVAASAAPLVEKRRPGRPRKNDLVVG